MGELEEMEVRCARGKVARITSPETSRVPSARLRLYVQVDLGHEKEQALTTKTKTKPKEKRFVIKKWNAVAMYAGRTCSRASDIESMRNSRECFYRDVCRFSPHRWSWAICTDTCAICRNNLYEPSIEYQANPTGASWGLVAHDPRRDGEGPEDYRVEKGCVCVCMGANQRELDR